MDKLFLLLFLRCLTHRLENKVDWRSPLSCVHSVMIVFLAQLSVVGDAFAHPHSLYIPPPLELHCHGKTIARCRSSYLYFPISPSPLLSTIQTYCWKSMRKGERGSLKWLLFDRSDKTNLSFTICLSYKRELTFIFVLTPSNFHPCNMLMSFLKVFYRLFISMRKRFYLTFYTTLLGEREPTVMWVRCSLVWMRCNPKM